jgi:hypothetical protein
LSPIVSDRCNQIEVDLSIQFDGQPALRAIEINDVIADAMLTSKFPALQLRTAQAPPKDGLGSGGRIPQPSADRLQGTLGEDYPIFKTCPMSRPEAEDTTPSLAPSSAEEGELKPRRS